MKKLLTALSVGVALTLTGCGADTSEQAAAGAPPTPPATAASAAVTAEAPRAPDLTGAWTQRSPTNPDSYQQATITANTISIDWVSDGGATTAVYWVGTYTAPTEATSPYTWTSQRDAAATDMALMASTVDSKDFTLTADTISYSVSALGMTTTVELARK